MITDLAEFSPGALVRARGREWVVQPGSTAGELSLRPLGGSEEDIALILPDLEFTPPEPAIFPLPDPSRHGSHQAATLLRDAIHLKLRNGAGPFRSFGNIAVEPRAYQLVPLLMALRLPVVRLLIADDVGIGKTIEAGLIVRELLDRGEITRCAILCPPHLVDQWQMELENRFHIRAIALTAASASRVERSLPPGTGLFDQHPFVVVSLDYIKSERHREHFLTAEFKNATVDAVTGEYSSDERLERVEALGEADQPILVATDCLSEGINLQHLFTAVVHYDLAWNPSRHEQREGRVDRFGQQAPEVRATMLYGQDNPVDGFILNVILRKAEAIRKELGLLVPLPADEQRINQALIKAALMKENRKQEYQTQFDFSELSPELATLDTHWHDAMENAKANRTVFAQRRLRPEEVLPEWEKQRALLGGSDDILRFVRNTCARLNSPLEPYKKVAWRLLPQHLPQTLRERLALEEITKPLAIYFDPKSTSPGARHVQRTHPIVSLLADTLLEDSLSGSEHPLAARCAATVTNAVSIVTSIFVLRLRHQLTSRRRDVTRTLMAEECVTLAVAGRANPQWLTDADLAPLLAAEPAANLTESAATQHIQTTLDFLQSQTPYLENLARQRADALLADHRRVRQAARDIGSYEVTPCLRVDVLGVYVLLPASL
jgi:hypothetical protein